MKKIFTALFAILLIASLSVTAFADGGIVNRIAGAGDTQPAASAGQSGMELIRLTGDQDEIVKPNYRSYFDVSMHPKITASMFTRDWIPTSTSRKRQNS